MKTVNIELTSDELDIVLTALANYADFMQKEADVWKKMEIGVNPALQEARAVDDVVESINAQITDL